MADRIRRDVAVLLLYNERGEVLLQHRDGNKLRFPNHWGLFGGGIEEGETPQQAMVRELKEELEYDSKDAESFGGIPFETAANDGVIYVFIERFDVSQKLVQHEGQDMQWFDPFDLGDISVIPHDKPIIESVGRTLHERGILQVS